MPITRRNFLAARPGFVGIAPVTRHRCMPSFSYDFVGSGLLNFSSRARRNYADCERWHSFARWEY